jgi:hypothetical protein
MVSSVRSGSALRCRAFRFVSVYALVRGLNLSTTRAEALEPLLFGVPYPLTMVKEGEGIRTLHEWRPYAANV